MPDHLPLTATDSQDQATGLAYLPPANAKRIQQQTWLLRFLIPRTPSSTERTGQRDKMPSPCESAHLRSALTFQWTMAAKHDIQRGKLKSMLTPEPAHRQRVGFPMHSTSMNLPSLSTIFRLKIRANDRAGYRPGFAIPVTHFATARSATAGRQGSTGMTLGSR